MLKRLLHMLLGYKIIITFADGQTEKTRAYLSSDCTVRARIWGRTQIRLEDNGCVRGLYAHNETKWKVI